MSGLLVKRILVALDASPHSHAALEEAAAMAAGLEAELTGIFVLDAELLRLSALPMARETGMASASRRALDPRSMERALKAQADRARAALEASARRHRLPCSFRMSRGNVVGELVEAAAEADLIAMGVLGQMGLSGSRLGSTTRQVWARSQCSLLLALGRGADGRVMAVCTDTPDAVGVLDLAVQQASRRAMELVVVLIGDDAARTRLREQVREHLADSSVQGAIVEVEGTQGGLEGLAQLIRHERAGLVVLSQDNTLVVDRDDLGRLDCSVLLVSTAESAASS